jgi:hypothetical protein
MTRSQADAHTTLSTNNAVGLTRNKFIQDTITSAALPTHNKKPCQVSATSAASFATDSCSTCSLALQLELKYAVGLQGAMDSTACTCTSKAWGKRHGALTNRKNRKPYLAFMQLEEQVHNQLMGEATAAGCGGSAADFFVAVPMQPDHSLKDYLIATARRNDPHYVNHMVHKAHASATEKRNAKIIKGLEEVVQAVAELKKDSADEIGEIELHQPRG